jgi:hypothetical protein
MRFEQYIEEFLNEARYRKIKLKKQKKFINQITRINKAKKITSEIFEHLSKLKNKSTISFNELLKQMNSISKRYRVTFIKNTKPNDNEWITYMYAGTGSTDFDGDIEIGLNRGVVNFIRSQEREQIADISNEIAKEIVGVMGHELIHRSQFLKYGYKIIKSVASIHTIKNEYSSYTEYLKQGHEMMAYAQDAAYEILNDKEPNMFYLYQNYFSKTEPQVFKRFMELMKQSYKKLSDGEELIIELK